MHAKPRRTPGYRGAHRRPSRLRLFARFLEVTVPIPRAIFG